MDSDINVLKEMLDQESKSLLNKEKTSNELLAAILKANKAKHDEDSERWAKSILQKKQSTKLNLFSIFIALSAVYISVFGVDNALTKFVVGMFL